MFDWSDLDSDSAGSGTFDTLEPQDSHEVRDLGALVSQSDLANPAADETARPPPRVFAISDIHTDYQKNLSLLRSWPQRKDDILIVAGDVTHNPTVLKETLSILVDKFAEVFYCPGNHDLWLHKDDGCTDSIAKFYTIQRLCDDLGVHTRPAVVRQDAWPGILIVPLLSWYHAAFDTDADVEDSNLTPVEQTMMDFYLCKWPSGLSASDGSNSVAEHFDGLNGVVERAPAEIPVISFSHFLPRPELLPEKRALFYPPLAKAVGSAFLGDRVRSLKPNLHIFGHTHYAWSSTLDGIRYVQACLAYPRERDERRFSVTVRKSSGEEAVMPLLVYDHEAKEYPEYEAFWSTYYSKVNRVPGDADWIYAGDRDRNQVLQSLQDVVASGKRVCTSTIDSQLLVSMSGF